MSIQKELKIEDTSQTEAKSSSVLQAVDLAKTFKKRKVVNSLSIEVHSGEIVGLLGPNGAGKTTTFNIMVGLIVPDQGAVLLNGKDISKLPMYKRARLGLGYLPQEPSIFRKLKVAENIMVILEHLPLSPAQRKERLEELLAELKLSHLKNNYAYTLSGGERRRLELCRSLVTSPSFLLLDEPFSGIDPISVFDIQEIINQLSQNGIGILVTDHSVRETLEITDRSYIIFEGRIELQGTSKELVASEKAREIYLGERFRL